jgi:hypothetical protein
MRHMAAAHQKSRGTPHITMTAARGRLVKPPLCSVYGQRGAEPWKCLRLLANPCVIVQVCLDGPSSMAGLLAVKMR